METLFSTVAQISFTIVGFFFLALTVDTNVRDFWLGDKALNKYVTINFFILLLPGFISIGWLIPFAVLGISAWLYITPMLFIVYFFYVYRELLMFYKSPAYNQIADYEGAIDAKQALKFGINGLFVLTVVGFYSVLANQPFYAWLSALLGIYLFMLVLTSVVPVYVLLRKGAEKKVEKDLSIKNNVLSSASIKSSETEGTKYLVVLMGALVAFLVGIFIRVCMQNSE